MTTCEEEWRMLTACDYCGAAWDLGEPDAIHVMGERKCCPDCSHSEVDA